MGAAGGPWGGASPAWHAVCDVPSWGQGCAVAATVWRPAGNGVESSWLEPPVVLTPLSRFEKYEVNF